MGEEVVRVEREGVDLGPRDMREGELLVEEGVEVFLSPIVEESKEGRRSASERRREGGGEREEGRDRKLTPFSRAKRGLLRAREGEERGREMGEVQKER